MKKKYLIDYLILLCLELLLIIVQITQRVNYTSRAAEYNVTGSWSFKANITSPASFDIDLIAQFSQNQAGRVEGVISQTDGSNSQRITGQVTGDQFKSDSTHAEGRVLIINYAADASFDGTISTDNLKMTGTVSGYTTKPQQGPIKGTFVAVRTSAPPPTATIPPSPTLIPTSVPTLTPTPTLVPTTKPTSPPSSTPTSTPAPQGTSVPPTLTASPTISPTISPIVSPIANPTASPTAILTQKPTVTLGVTSTSTPQPSPTEILPPVHFAWEDETFTATEITPSIIPTLTPTPTIKKSMFGIWQEKVNYFLKILKKKLELLVY